MNQQIPDLPDPAVLKQAVDLHEHQAKRWRRLWIATFVAYFLAIAFMAFGAVEWRENNVKRDVQIDNLQAIAEDIDAATGPAAQEAQQLVISHLVDAIDCSQRDAFQDALDALVDEGILHERITIRPPRCQEAP